MATNNLLFRKNDAWTLTLSPLSDETTPDRSQSQSQSQPQQQHQTHLKVLKILQNNFPTSLSAHIALTSTSSSLSLIHI